MAPRPTRKACKTTSALAALSLLAGLAREAIDGVPVAKQVVGVVTRILALAEKVDRDREALHALADQALAFAYAIQDVLQVHRRDMDGVVAHSLEKVLEVAKSVEEIVERHAARKRLMRALAYTFAVSPQVERLTRELSDAVQLFGVVAQIDTNLRVRAADETARDNSRYDGEFRLLRHCDVEKGDLVIEEVSGDGYVRVRYHRAQVDGGVYVVRYFEHSTAQASGAAEHSAAAVASELYERVTAHDRILTEISTVQKSHRNVALIYGWNKASTHNKFTVLKAGFIPAEKHFQAGIEPVEIISDIFKLIDAARHLQNMGVAWYPPYRRDVMMVDQHGEPTIGLRNDLRKRTSIIAGDAYWRQIAAIFAYHFAFVKGSVECARPGTEYFLSADRIRDSRIETLLSRGGEMETKRWVVPRHALSGLRVVSPTNAAYLAQAEQACCGIRVSPWLRMAALLPRATCTQPCATLTVCCNAHLASDSITFVSLMEMIEDAAGVVFTHHMISEPRLTPKDLVELCGAVVPNEAEILCHPWADSEVVHIPLFETSCVLSQRDVEDWGGP